MEKAENKSVVETVYESASPETQAVLDLVRNIFRDELDIVLEKQTPDGATLVAALMYFVMFVVGVCGNVVVLHTMIRLRGSGMFSSDFTFIHIFSLSLVDLLALFSLPMTISDILLGRWMLGFVLCKLFWLMESSGKIYSTLVLTLMSFQRCVAVCWSPAPVILSRRTTYILLFSLLGLGSLILLPLPLSATGQWLPRPLKIHTGENFTEVSVTTFKCALDPSSKIFGLPYTLTIFFVGHIIPGLHIIIFSSLMLTRIARHQSRFAHCRNSEAGIPLRQIVIFTISTNAFYFVCWSPYWALTILTSTQVYQMKTVTLAYFVHSLPFLSSSLNWIFYALLNKQLQRAKAQEIASLKSTTTPNQSEYRSLIAKSGPGRNGTRKTSLLLRGNSEDRHYQSLDVLQDEDIPLNNV